MRRVSLFGVRRFKTSRDKILGTENAFDRRTTPSDHNPAYASFQICLDAGDLDLQGDAKLAWLLLTRCP